MADSTFIFIFVSYGFSFYFFNRPRFVPSVSPLVENNTKISIIIPARNEANNLRRLLISINAQSVRPFEVLVMNDHSMDLTSAVGRSLGATVIDVPELPNDWNGKPFACATGAAAAKGDYFLFVDADVEFETLGLAKIANLPDGSETTWSICPYHRIEKFYEEFSSIFNLTMVAGTGAFAIANQKKSRLVGQAMLVSKKNYDCVGGHATVKNRVLENYFLTEAFQKNGIATVTLGGKGSLSMRMFPDGFSALLASWKKGFVTGAAKTPMTIMLPIVLWMIGGITALVFMIKAVVVDQSKFAIVTSMMLYGLYVGEIRRMYRAIGTFSLFNAVFYPVFFVFFILLFSYSAFAKLFGQKTIWKARNVG